MVRAAGVIEGLVGERDSVGTLPEVITAMLPTIIHPTISNYVYPYQARNYIAFHACFRGLHLMVRTKHVYSIH